MNSRIIIQRCNDTFYSLVGTIGGFVIGGVIGVIVSAPFYDKNAHEEKTFIILPVFIVAGTLLGAGIDIWRWRRRKNIQDLIDAQLRMSPEELAAMGVTDTAAEIQPRNQENKILIDWVKQVIANTAPGIALLTTEEIEQFRKILAILPDQQKQAEKLTEYETYFQDKCILSYTKMQDIKNPITIRGSIQEQDKISHWYSTYNSEEFIKHLETTPVLAKDPLTNCVLINNHSIKLENGFANHQLLFIETVRQKIKAAKPNVNPQGFFAPQPETDIATSTLSNSLKM